MPKQSRALCLIAAALLLLMSGADAPVTASPSSEIAGPKTYLYFRLSPAEPWLDQIVRDMAVEHKALGSAVYITVAPGDAPRFYDRVTGIAKSEGVSMSFEQIPRMAYEHPELYPQGIYRSSGVPAITPRALETQLTAIVIDDTTYGGLSERLATYIVDVTAHFPDVTLRVYHPSSAQLGTSADVRAFLQQLHQTDGVNGAILVGYFPYAVWKMPWGETASLALFYEDLDGLFLDQDSDGLYDYHDWGPSAGLEMWISWIRPPAADPVSYLRNYFDKVHAYYENDDLHFKRAWLTINRDWCGARVPLGDAFQEAYGDDWDFLGCETPDAYLVDYTSRWTANDYQLQNLWAHSSNMGHQFDWDDSQPPGNWLSAQQLGALPRGPQLSILWACKAMSFTGEPDSNLSTWYIMGDNNGMSAIGVSRSIGTPMQEYLIANIHETNGFADLLSDYLNIVTSREFLLSNYPDELHTFVWDVIFTGNPYLFAKDLHAIDLTVAKTHVGSFMQGQVGATYTITVTNSGTDATNGAVTVTDTLPTGMTATDLSGTGWSCTLATLDCTRSDVLNGGTSYPALTLTVNMASNAPTSVTNNVWVTGGGELNTGNNTASDPTTVTPVADLTVAKTHAGNFTQGQLGATYAITVTNSGEGMTSGTVTVADTLPTGMMATGLSGAGWSCTLAELSCTRSDVLNGASSYPALTLTVNVASNAPASVTNSVAVTGGGELNTGNSTASDPTNIMIETPRSFLPLIRR